MSGDLVNLKCKHNKYAVVNTSYIETSCKMKKNYRCFSKHWIGADEVCFFLNDLMGWLTKLLKWKSWKILMQIPKTNL